MDVMSAPPVESADLLDLKFLPEWVKEPRATNHYDHYTAEETPTEVRGRDRFGRHKDRSFPSRERRGHTQRPGSKPDRRPGRTPKAEGTRRRDFDRTKDRRSPDHAAQPPPKPFEGTLRFLPRQNVFENVVAQIKSGSVAYSLFVLARLFLEKAGRYEVRLTAKAEVPLFQLGEDGGISMDRRIPGAKRVPVRPTRLLPGQRCRKRSDKRKFLECRQMSVERHASGPDQSPCLSAAIAKLIRATFQPANELCRLSAANRDRKRSRGGRAVERGSQKGHHLRNGARRNTSDVFVCCGSGTTFSFALFADTHPQCGRRDCWRHVEPEFARPNVESGRSKRRGCAKPALLRI